MMVVLHLAGDVHCQGIGEDSCCGHEHDPPQDDTHACDSDGDGGDDHAYGKSDYSARTNPHFGRGHNHDTMRVSRATTVAIYMANVLPTS